jgi:hypothetical protein
MPMAIVLTAEQLRELLHYDPETGTFTWLVMPSNNTTAGSIAGCPDDQGYIMIRVRGARYKAHRLAVLYMTGTWPRLDIDHRDGDRGNNRWLNLREADDSQNGANAKVKKNNTSGHKGVCFSPRKGSWVARITVQRRRLYIGSYPSAAEAGAAYMQIAKKIYGEFARAC